MNTVSTALYFKDAKSDKQYNAYLEKSGKLFVVNFAYGKRGGNLKEGTKTPDPVAYDKALAIYEKLVKSKTDKGYAARVEGAEKNAAEAETDAVQDLSNFNTLKKLLKPFESEIDIPEGLALEDVEAKYDSDSHYTADCQRLIQLGLEGPELNDLFGWDYTEDNFLFELRDFETQPFSSWHWLDIVDSDELEFFDDYCYYIGDFPTGDGFFQIKKGTHKGKLAFMEHGWGDELEEVIDEIDKNGSADEIIAACEFMEISEDFNDLEDYFVQRIKSIKKKKQVDVKKVVTKTSKRANNTILNLSKKKLKSIPDEVFEMTDLIELDLSENKITNVDVRIGQLINLQILRLDNNNIKSISPEISKLSQLRKLNLSHNKFDKDLPSYLVDFEHLEELDFMCIAKENRAIMKMPQELFQLKKLKKFSNGGIYFTNYPCTYGINGNPLNMEPMALAKELLKDDCTSSYEYLFHHADSKTITSLLEEMYDSETKTMDLSVSVVMSKLPKELLNFDIKNLNLSKCELGIGTDLYSRNVTPKAIRIKYEQLHASNLAILSEMTTLEDLNLADNGILSLPDLSKLTRLKSLSLARNHISEIPGLEKLIHLTYLNMSANELIEVPVGIFNFSQLYILDISYAFTIEENINTEVFKSLKNLKELEEFDQSLTLSGGITKKALKEYLPKGCKLK